LFVDWQGQIRVSDSEREATIAHLNVATVEGRLSLEEFGDRARLAHAASTRDELATLVADLPAPLPAGTSTTAQPSSTLPAWALTLGVFSLLMVFCTPFGLPVGAAGTVLGAVGLFRARRGMARFPGIALAGVICGSVGFTFGLILLIIIGGPNITVK
jgi:hypothetical protein